MGTVLNQVLPYSLVMLIASLIAFLYDCSVDESDNTVKSVFRRYVLLILTILPILLIAGCRGLAVGVDNKYVYYPEFQMLRYSTYHHSDIGFYTLSKIVYSVTGSYQPFVFVLSLIFISGFYSFATLFKRNVCFITILLFLSFNLFASFSLIAQFTAIGMGLFGLRLLVEDHRVASFVVIVIGSTFHVSELVFLLFWIGYIALSCIKPLNLARRILFLAYVFGALVGIVLIPILASYTRFKHYATATQFSSLSSTSFIVINVFITLLVILLYYRTNKFNDNKLLFLLLVMQASGTVLSFFQGQILLLVRMLYYFNIFQCFIVPASIQYVENKLVRNVLRIAVIGSFALWVLLYPFSQNAYDVLPYYFA